MRRARMEEQWNWRGEMPVVCCPECGEELGGRDEIFTLELSGVVLGCSVCLHPHSAVEWYAQELDLELAL